VPGVLLSPEYLAPTELDVPTLLAVGDFDAVMMIFGRQALLSSLVTVGVLGSVACAALRFGLWWRARLRSGAITLLASALLAVMPLVWMLVMLALSQPWYEGFVIPQWFDQTIVALLRIPRVWFWIAESVALLLFVYGLLRTGLIPTWLGAVGLAAAILSVAALLELRVFDQTSALHPLSAMAETVLLVGIAVTLGREALHPTPNDHRAIANPGGAA
jgi:hypothetical protein